MTDILELKSKMELLEEEISNLKGIVHVMLEELENGSIQVSARRIREVLEQTDNKDLS